MPPSDESRFYQRNYERHYGNLAEKDRRSGKA